MNTRNYLKIFIIFLFDNLKFFKCDNQNRTIRRESNVDPSVEEDANLIVPGLLKKYKYPSETHYVTTDDGYILTMHRIPNIGGSPVLLQHGILDSSVTWIVMGTKVGLGYLLYDLGYDVWMGNNRGNRYSKNHTHLPVNGYEFWNFSWHEMGVHDLPAMIDFILHRTGYKKLHYIAHSQGTTAFWVMCVESPEYNKKILLMQALAPVAYMDDTRSPVIKLLLKVFNTAEAIADTVGINEFSLSKELLKKSGETLCHDQAITLPICTSALFLICGYNNEQLNKTMLPALLAHTAAGASVKQFIHYGQLARSGKFCRYDYGYTENMKRYGTPKPLDYQLNHITAPLIFHYSKNDWISGWEAVERFYHKLSNPIMKIRYLVPNKNFNHLDFVWAIDARKLLYNRVVKLMKRFELKERKINFIL